MAAEKSEKQKMLDGELYYAGGPELTAEREKAHTLAFEYNNLRTRDPQNCTPEKLNALLKEMGVKFDEEHPPFIEPSLFVDYGYNITLGKNFYANFNNTLLDCAEITIGDNCFFAPNVQLYTPGHPLDIETRGSLKFGLEFAKPIRIGNNVWLGGGVIVCPGVTIGNGVTVGAGSVVTKDVPDNVVVAGNPARIIRRLEPKN